MGESKTVLLDDLCVVPKDTENLEYHTYRMWRQLNYQVVLGEKVAKWVDGEALFSEKQVKRITVPAHPYSNFRRKHKSYDKLDYLDHDELSEATGCNYDPSWD